MTVVGAIRWVQSMDSCCILSHNITDYVYYVMPLQSQRLLMKSRELPLVSLDVGGTSRIGLKLFVNIQLCCPCISLLDVRTLE